MRFKRNILACIISLSALFLVGCKEAKPIVENDLDILNAANIINDESRLSNMEANFVIDENVEMSSDAFDLFDLLTNDMVLQANAIVRVFGQYNSDGPIALEINDQTYYENIVDHKFEFYIGPFAYGGPYDLTLYTQNHKTVLSNVLFGEVFLLSGQSNMAVTMSRILETSSGQTKADIEEAIQNADYEMIRFNTIGTLGSDVEQDSFVANQVYSWDVLSNDNVYGLSATAFYYAKELYERYQVPIGLVVSAVGATFTNTWIPQEEAQNLDQSYVRNISDADTPSRHFNSMIAPLKQYTFRGVVWYQGEGQHISYYDNMVALIDGWRRVFDNPELKFLIIELPRIDFDMNYTQSSWFKVREQQKKLADYEGVTYSVNIDLGIKESQTTDPMHPFDKEMIGKRAAHAFMKAFYHEEGVLTSPKLIFAGNVDGKLTLKFTNVGDGLYLSDYLAGFEVSSDGINYTYARPSIVDTSTIELETSQEQVISIRYGYSYVVPEVFNNGVPVYLSQLVCVYNSSNYPLDQFEVIINE